MTVFSVYSYAKLGAKYPSRGGAAQFLIRCFGDGVIAGGLNVFQFLAGSSRWPSTAPGSSATCAYAGLPVQSAICHPPASVPDRTAP